MAVAGGRAVDLWVPLLKSRARQEKLAQDWTGSARILPLESPSAAEMLRFRFDGDGGAIVIREQVAVRDGWDTSETMSERGVLGEGELTYRITARPLAA